MGKRQIKPKGSKTKMFSHKPQRADTNKLRGTKWEKYVIDLEARDLIKKENMKEKKERRRLKHG